MFGHYMRVALRNFRRTPVITAINVLTLALGLICFVVAYAIVGYWNHSEQGFSNADRTYAITADLSLRDGSVATGVFANSQAFLADYIRADFPEVETVARARPGQEVPLTVGESTLRLPLAYADAEFLHVFDLPFVHGGGPEALRQPESVVMSEDAAIRLFGRANVVGEKVIISDSTEATVNGVFRDIPQPSHVGTDTNATLRFEVLTTYAVYERFLDTFQQGTQTQTRGGQASPDGPDDAAEEEAPPPPQNWLGGYCCTTYVLLPEDGSLTEQQFYERLAGFAERHVPKAQLSFAEVEIGAVPIRDLTVMGLNSVLFSGTAPGMDITVVLLALGGLVMVVAAINYANIATARATNRAREVGMRKAVGAERRQVMFQYILEGGLLTLAALILALVVILAIRAPLRTAMGVDVGMVFGDGFSFIAFLVGLVIVVSVAAGAYPAFVLARVRPMDALRAGKVRTGPRFVPSLLVGVQFVAASFLIIAVTVMYMQNMELRRTGLGRGEDPVAMITNLYQFTGVDPQLLFQELERLPQVKAVSATQTPPWSQNVGVSLFSRTPEESSKVVSALQTAAYYGYFETMNIKVLAGRVYSRERDEGRLAQAATGASTENIIVADEAFIEELGFESPEAAVDQLVHVPRRVSSAFSDTEPVPSRIIGVVETKPQSFLGLGAESRVFFPGRNPIYVLVRLDRGDVAAGREAIEELWQTLAPRRPIIMQFTDQLFEQSYKTFGQINSAFAGLAVFALAISAIGLFGMAIQVTTRRIHEIGVRKTLGASTRQILVMLLKDFSKPVVIANVIAWPLGFIAAQMYLNVFVHRISLSPTPFVLSLLLALLIAWISVSAMAWRAAQAQPAQVLKYE